MLVVLALGCGSPATFGDDYTELLCERSYECAQGSFDALYGDVGECRAERTEQYGVYYRCQLEGCAFDSASARSCLGSLRRSDCEAIVDGSAFESCDDVYYDCDWAVVNACGE